MATKCTFNLVDYSGERTSTHVYLPSINAGTFDAVIASAGALQTALLLATDCNHVNTTLTIETDDTTPSLPSIETAQREFAVRIKYADATTGDIAFCTVPGPAVTFYPPQGVKGDIIPLDNAVFAAFITVMEANMKSKLGNAITVLEGRLVGRNN